MPKMGCHGYGYDYRNYKNCDRRNQRFCNEAVRCNKLQDKCLKGSEQFYKCTTPHNVNAQRKAFSYEKDMQQVAANKAAAAIAAAHVQACKHAKAHQKAVDSLTQNYRADYAALSIVAEQAKIVDAHTKEVATMVRDYKQIIQNRRKAYEAACCAINNDSRKKLNEVDCCAQAQSKCIPKCDQGGMCALEHATNSKRQMILSVANQNKHKLAMEYRGDRKLLSARMQRDRAQRQRYFRVKLLFVNARYQQQQLQLYREYAAAHAEEVQSYQAKHHAAFRAYEHAVRSMNNSNQFMANMQAVVHNENNGVVAALDAEEGEVLQVIALLEQTLCEAFLCAQQKKAAAIELEAARRRLCCIKKSKTTLSYQFCQAKKCVSVEENAASQPPMAFPGADISMPSVDVSELACLQKDLRCRNDGDCASTGCSSINCCDYKFNGTKTNCSNCGPCC